MIDKYPLLIYLYMNKFTFSDTWELTMLFSTNSGMFSPDTVLDPRLKAVLSELSQSPQPTLGVLDLFKVILEAADPTILDLLTRSLQPTKQLPDLSQSLSIDPFRSSSENRSTIRNRESFTPEAMSVLEELDRTLTSFEGIFLSV